MFWVGLVNVGSAGEGEVVSKELPCSFVPEIGPYNHVHGFSGRKQANLAGFSLATFPLR